MEHKTDEDGVKWISCDALTVGDYGGYSSVGEANIRTLEEEETEENPVWVEHSHYSFKQAWVLDTPENRDMIGSLECDYLLLDDEMESRVVMEWEDEAWGLYLRSDLLHTLGRNSYLKDWAEDLEDSVLRGMYEDAKKKTNTEVIPEYNGVYVNVDRMKDKFRDRVLKEFDKHITPYSEHFLLKTEDDFRVFADYLKDKDLELESQVVLELLEEE